MNARAPTEATTRSEETTRVRVRDYVPGDEKRWESFIAAAPDATFFHRIGWRNIVDECFGHRTHYLVAERGDRISGVLPLAEVKSIVFGHSLVSLPFCAYGGVAAADTETVTALHLAARQRAEDLDVEYLELRNRDVREPSWPRQELYVTFRRDLFPDAEANMLAIPRKQRAMVRKGIAKGLKSEIDPDFNRFFPLFADNMHRHGTPPLPKRYFKKLKQVFGDDVEVMTVLTPGGKPLSGVVTFYFRDEILPYYAGDREDARDFAANDFKYWELMRRACERRVRVFDYGRSKRGTGPFAFKKNWGFEPTPLAYEYSLVSREKVPENNPLNPKYRAMIAVWRRLPIKLANVLGPLVVKNLG